MIYRHDDDFMSMPGIWYGSYRRAPLWAIFGCACRKASRDERGTDAQGCRTTQQHLSGTKHGAKSKTTVKAGIRKMHPFSYKFSVSSTVDFVLGLGNLFIMNCRVVHICTPCELPCTT